MNDDIKSLGDNASMDYEDPKEFPAIIPNSTAQFDGDFNAYLYAWLDQSLAQNLEAVKTDLERKRKQAGCEILNVHTTHGNKAGRNDFAMVKEYQVNRNSGKKDPEKSLRVKQIREFMQTYETDVIKPFPQYEVEADDSMSIMQGIDRELGCYSIIITKDKDLDMVAGMHMDLDTGEVYEVPDGYGFIELIERRKPANNKKGYTVKNVLKGKGKAFFWAQMLMGDSADSIPGCPKLTAKLLNKYFPTQKVTKAQEDIRNHKNVAKAYKVLQERKPASIGAVTAYTLLKDCKTNKDALDKIREVYMDYYGTQPFTFEDWRGNRLELTHGHMILEQARLLWMLRTWEDDALLFFGEVIQDV